MENYWIRMIFDIVDYVVCEDEFSEEEFCKNYLWGMKGIYVLFLMVVSIVFSFLNLVVNICDGLDVICCSCSFLNFLLIFKEKIFIFFCFKLLVGMRILFCEMLFVMIIRIGFFFVFLFWLNKYLERISMYYG